MKVPLKVLGLLRDSLGNVDGSIWGSCMRTFILGYAPATEGDSSYSLDAS